LSSSLRVGVDARLTGPEGGVGSFVVGLSSGLSQLEDGEEFLFLPYHGYEDWLRPYLKGACRLVAPPPKPAGTKAFIERHLPHRITQFAKRRSRLEAAARDVDHQEVVEIPHSDGSIEREGIEVMHLTRQLGFLTEVPTIYHPHDLQHLHYPQYFDPEELDRRELYYRGLCAQAEVVAVSSNWTKNDLIRAYGLSAQKIQVVPLAPLLGAYAEPYAADVTTVRAKFSLPESGFAFYPAQTWPHKNHMMLLEALAQLKREGLKVPFVSSGVKTEFYARIEDRARQLGIDDQVSFLGFVSSLELQCLYRLSRCVVIPTKFEAASFPLWEAFLAGTPAACSTVTSLPEQAGDAALLFDPDEPEEIAAAVRSLWTDEALRDTLVTRGHENVSRLSWTRTARIFRALYRKTAGRELGSGDRALLTEADDAL
jgi:glycosyltransferase involved in cell wall biosynthesis